MDNLRLVLWAGFFVMLWLGVNQWSSDYGAPNPPSAAPAQTNTAPPQTKNNTKEAPGILELSDNLPVVAAESGPTEAFEKPRLSTRLVTVKTDVFELGINPDKGGDIVQATLLKYFPNKDDKSKKIELLSYNEDNYQYFQTGLLSLSGLPEPNHQQVFLEKDKKLELREGQEQISTSLVWETKQDQTNLEVKKSYTFQRGRYDILLTYDIKNLGT